MPEMSYVFGDVTTGNIIAEINSLYGVSMNERFGGGEFRASYQLDQTGQENSVLINSTYPGRCYVVAERNSIPIWGGIVRSRTYQSQAKSMQLYASSFALYPQYRLVLSDFIASEQDQISIFLNLFAQMQSMSNSVIVNLPSAFSSGILKTIEVLASEYKTYDSVLRSLSDADDGFDWDIRVRRQDGIYQRDLLIGIPTLGAKDPSGITFEYPGNILNYWKNEGMNNSGTHFFGVGAGEGSSMITASHIHQDLMSSGFPRYEETLSHKDIEDVNRLQAVVTNDAFTNKPPKGVFTIQIRADREPEFGSYKVGDACTIIIKDPRHPSGINYPTRILSYEYYPPTSERAEEVRLNFEGDDDF